MLPPLARMRSAVSFPLILHSSRAVLGIDDVQMPFAGVSLLCRGLIVSQTFASDSWELGPFHENPLLAPHSIHFMIRDFFQSEPPRKKTIVSSTNVTEC